MANEGWALDLGTTNTGLARWDEAAGQPQLVELPRVCRRPDSDDPLAAPQLIPTAVDLIDRLRLRDRLGGWAPLERLMFLGRRAHIGRQALERNASLPHPSFVPAFKPSLTVDALRSLGRVGRRPVTARMAARAFLRELLAEARLVTGRRIRELVVTSPVSAFETYRAEVQRCLRAIGVRRLRFVDEPVAAALGYGLNLTRDRTILVVDVGGGTMHMALVRLSPGGATRGEALVLAKQVRPFGGNAVDGWVLADVCEALGAPLDDDASETTRLWRRLMLAEACRVKEAVFFDDSATFLLSPPGYSSVNGRLGSLPYTRQRLTEVLTRNGFYQAIESCLDVIFAERDPSVGDVEDVLFVGGSTLLPGVFALLEGRFGRTRLRGWHPFEAVAVGAACYSAERIEMADFIVHDYAFLTHEPRTKAAIHTVVVPRGTRIPTPFDFWKGQVVPTCSLGEAESLFKLVICEIARGDGSPRRLVWDAAGDLHRVGGSAGEAEVIVPLNAASPTLGHLDPPHAPTDRRPRLSVAFGVNADRWLVATVSDLLTRRELMREEPVVRLV